MQGNLITVPVPAEFNVTFDFAIYLISYYASKSTTKKLNVAKISQNVLC